MAERWKDSGLRLSVQRALRGAVPPILRACSVELRGPVLLFRAVFSREPTDDERELLSAACTEMVADFPEVMDAREEFLVVPPPEEPQHLAELVFPRAGPDE